jgi:hypothetical protein
MKAIPFILIIAFFSGCISPAIVIENPPQFDISISSSGSCYTNDGNFTIALFRNGTTLLNWTTPQITFTVSPVVPVGSTTKDRTTIYFSVEEYDSQLIKFRDLPQIKWEVNSNRYLIEGSKTMYYTDKQDISLSFDFNLYELQRTSDSSMRIKFSNFDGSWSKYYNLNLTVIDLN